MDWVVTEKELRFVSAFTICKKTKTKPKELSRFQLLVARFFYCATSATHIKCIIQPLYFLKCQNRVVDIKMNKTRGKTKNCVENERQFQLNFIRSIAINAK